MSRRVITRLKRIAAVTSIAVVGGFAVGASAVHAGQGPICEDNEKPVCEEPPPPPPSSPVSQPQGHITVFPVEDNSLFVVQPCSSLAGCTLTLRR